MLPDGGTEGSIIKKCSAAQAVLQNIFFNPGVEICVLP